MFCAVTLLGAVHHFRLQLYPCRPSLSADRLSTHSPSIDRHPSPAAPSHLKRAASTAAAPATFCICSKRIRFCSAASRAASAAAASCFASSRSDSFNAPASCRCSTAAAVWARFMVAAALRALACADARRRIADSCSTLAASEASFAAFCALIFSRRLSSCNNQDSGAYPSKYSGIALYRKLLSIAGPAVAAAASEAVGYC